LNIRLQFKLITYNYEPSVSDASEPNKQIYQKCSAAVSHILLWGRYELIRVKYDNSLPCSYCQTGSFEAGSYLHNILEFLGNVQISFRGLLTA